MEDFKVFVSSTSLDLMAERKAVAEVLRKSELRVTAMEDWDALPSDATSVSVDGVNNCDIFVGIYAFRYGFIPPGSASSITEQEYDQARREGKRCLCYFKDEANAAPPTDPKLIEPETSLNQLAAFKQRIEKELVRGRFTSPDDLKAKLAIDISRLKAGYLPGYSRQDFLSRWATHGMDARSQLVQGPLSGHTNILPSPALQPWSTFIKEQSWHRVVERDLRSISQLAGDLPRVPGLSKRANDLANRIEGGETGTISNYHTMLTDLDQTITDTDIRNAEASIKELQRQVDAAHEPGATPNPDAAEKLPKARNLIRELRDLREDIKRPSFRKCFPVIGSLGSGRTHFIASLVGSTPNYSAEEPVDPNQQWCENDNFVVLLLNNNSINSLEQTVLDGINRACELQWQSLDEFDRFLNAKTDGSEEQWPIRFCIAIDDLQRWLQTRKKFTNPVDELTQFIESHTRLSSLFWLFTLQDTSYSFLQNLNNLLRSYSYFQTEIQPEVRREPQKPANEVAVSHFSGWLALDDLNRDVEFGLRLIETALQKEGAALPAVDLLRQNQAVLRNLIKPFVATVLLDMHSEAQLNLERLATLSYMSFVREFWKKRKDEFTTEYTLLRSGFDDSSQALKLVAETLTRTGEFNPSQKDMEKWVVEAAQKEGHRAPEQMVTAALEALTTSGFLTRYMTPDPQMPEYEVQMIGFEFEPFWELRLATHLRAWQSFKELNKTAARDELINWFGVVDFSEIEEGVLEFLLLLLDGDAGNNIRKRDLVSFLQQSAIDSTELPEEAVWFSGANATIDSQVELMKLVGRGKNQFKVNRLLHSIMYFLVESLPEVSEPADRLRILQPHFNDINRASLSAYFLYIARRLLDQANNNEAVGRAMHYLNGCEVMGIAQALGSLTVEVMFRKAEIEFGELNDESLKSVISVLIDYLRDSNEEAKKEYKRRGKIERWERFFYREWVLRFFCKRLVRERGIEAYHLLDGMHWYNPRTLDISPPTAVEMDREANFALGDQYRMRRYSEYANLYVELIRQLVYNGDYNDRRTAFFLIRHSEPTHGQEGLWVDEELAPMLREIFLDPKLADTVTRFYEMFRINLDDFKKLEILRARKLRK